MRTEDPQIIQLVDYRPPDFLIDRMSLDIKLDLKKTRAISRLSLRPNPAGRADVPLVLDGDNRSAWRQARRRAAAGVLFRHCGRIYACRTAAAKFRVGNRNGA